MESLLFNQQQQHQQQLYNPELEMMRWRLQVLAMGLQHQSSLPAPFVPFHLQQPEYSAMAPQFPQAGPVKQEPVESQGPDAGSSPPSLLYRPAFQTRSGSVSPRTAESSSPSSYRSSPSPNTSHTSPGFWSPARAAEQSEPLDLSMAAKVKMEPVTPASVMTMGAPETSGPAQSCTVCNKEYSSPAALNMHMRTHTAGCKCPFCGKSFSRPWLLQGHIRTHTGEKPYNCNQCSKSFADKSNLRAHVQTHSDVKPFGCNRCGKKFALKSYLTKHEESSCLRLTGPRF